VNGVVLFLIAFALASASVGFGALTVLVNRMTSHAHIQYVRRAPALPLIGASLCALTILLVAYDPRQGTFSGTWILGGLLGFVVSASVWWVWRGARPKSTKKTQQPQPKPAADLRGALHSRRQHGRHR
jgi:hypothetical protein